MLFLHKKKQHNLTFVKFFARLYIGHPNHNLPKIGAPISQLTRNTLVILLLSGITAKVSLVSTNNTKIFLKPCEPTLFWNYWKYYCKI